eukprot:TRINITY_DN8648_c0_g1_i1.p1 TRINITY_DN8648_c0_g1~~TRINITY_DN8648_c0_g1_i1.p1  ORF type:complete len:259 (+),score=26.12 TRINITY_DN8648_c0_g1_i1:47-823(+)
MGHRPDDIQVASEHHECLKSILSRFTTSELAELFLPTATKKSDILKEVISTHYKEGMTYAEVAELDLWYTKSHSSKKQWKAFEIKNNSSAGEQPQVELEPEKIRLALSPELDSYFHHYTHVKLFSLQGIWIRVSIDDKVNNLTKQSLSNWCVSYIVYFPHLKYLLTNGLVAAHKKFILHSLQTTLKCSGIIDHQLKGADLESMKKMLAAEQSQGVFKMFQSVENNPLDRSNAAPVVCREKKEKFRVVNEDQDLIDRRL